MSVVAAAVVLGLIVVLLIKWKLVKVFVAVVCILFGLVLGVTPIGEGALRVVRSAGAFTATQLERL